MHIGNIPQNTNVQQINTGGAAEPAQSGGAGSAGTGIAADLSAGDTVSGKVLTRDGELVQILLNDDSVLEAKLANDMQLQTGQMISFAVKSSGREGVALMPLFTNTAEMSTASKALLGAGLGQTGKNLQMVSDMMREGMPIGRDSLLYINKQLMANPNANVTDIVQMNRMGIPVTEANLEQFQNYKAYEHQINAATDHIFSLVPDTFEELMSQGLTDEAVQLYKDIISLAVGESIDAAKEPDGSETAENAAAELPETAVPGEEVQKAVIQEDALQDREEAVKTDALLNLLKEVSEEKPDPASKSGADKVDQNSQDPQALHPSFQNAGISKEEITQLADRLRQAGAPKEMTDALLKGELPAGEVLKFVNRPEVSGEDLISLLRHPGFQKLAKSELAAQWKITPEQASSKTEVEELYNKINDQTKQLMSALHAAAKGDSPMAHAVTNLQNNMDFMNQLNHMFPYIQLPLKMSGSEAHGDLYVYTNKKNLAKDDGTVSALLHLDMDHLGPMNVFVKMNQNNHVNTNFYLADEAALDLVAAHMDELTDRLQKRGYQVDVRYALNEDKTTVMDEMIKQDRTITTISSTSFDARA